MADEVDKLALTMVALQLYPGLTMEQLAGILKLQRSMSALFWKTKALSLLAQGLLTCEVCGDLFQATSGYYEPGEYAYCAECCHW
jgi:hypothetical protein